MLDFNSRREAIHAKSREPPTMELREEELAGSLRPSLRQVTPAEPDCVLAIGSQRLPAILAEDRNDALDVLIQASPLFWVEDCGVLQTKEAEIAVRVSRIVHKEIDEDDSTSTLPVFCIGLAKLAGTAAKAQSRPVPAPLQKIRRDLLSPSPRSRLRLTLGGLVAFALIVTPLVFVAAAWHHHVHSGVVANADETPPDVLSPSPMVEQPSDEPAWRPKFCDCQASSRS